MKFLWEYALPTEEGICDYDYESPILIRDDHVYFVSRRERFGYKRLLHYIDTGSGTGTSEEFMVQNGLGQPENCFFIEYQGNVILCAGDLLVCRQGKVVQTVKLPRYQERVAAHLLFGNRLILFCSRAGNGVLCCCNLDTLSIEWQRDITNSKHYRAGEISAYENLIACYGDDSLLFIECETGKTVDAIRLSRIDKLYCPVKIDDANMLIGYTNWTNAGILKYNTAKKEIVWRHKRKFQGPQSKCKIYRQDQMAFWVKNSTELVAVNIETGDEVYHVRTVPWLYTDLQFWKNNLLYGTSGADGYINNIEAMTGRELWSVFLKNGCVYYDRYQESVIVGDFNKTLKQIAISNGKILQNYITDGEVVGRIKVFGGCVYTVLWENEKKGVRLVKVQIDSKNA